MRASPRALVLLVVASLACLRGATSAHAQVPFRLLDSGTEVRSLSFRFPEGRSFSYTRLREEIVLTATGRLAGLRRRLDILPFITAPGRHPFTPLELQRDVARLRRFYSTSGFLDPDIRYDVSFDSERNVVAVVFVVVEGRPLALDALDFRTPEGADPAEAFDEELVDAWTRFRSEQARELGQRLGNAERTAIQSRALGWMQDYGYAYAGVRSVLEVDSVAATAALTIEVAPGARARVDSIRIEGNRQVDDAVVLRSVPLREGDWFSGSRLAEGQRRVFGLDLFSVALADVPEQKQDSTVTVRLRVEENPPRLVSGEGGFASEAGLTLRGQWAHRNFLGDARTLQVNFAAQTGYWALEESPDRRYQLGLNYLQPAFLHPRLTLNVRPYGEYRNVLIDRSWQAAVETSLVYELGPYRFVSLQHRFGARRVIGYNVTSDGWGNPDRLRALLAGEEPEDVPRRIDRSVLSLSGTVGRYDPTTQTAALQARPSFEVTTPPGLNTIEWARADLTVVGRLPLSDRARIEAKAQIGTMLLFGASAPGAGDPTSDKLKALLLREVLFTAGGTGSVRGWGYRAVGPKWPDVRFQNLGTDPALAVATSYLAAGGRSRILGSVELSLPFPGLGPAWGTHLFMDAARIAHFEGTFQPEESEGERGMFYGTGGGIDVATPVGPVRLTLGYKLNASPFDLRRSDEVLAALLEGRPLDSVPVRKLQRLHVHLSLGQSF